MVDTFTLTGDLRRTIGPNLSGVRATLHLHTQDGSWVNTVDHAIHLPGDVIPLTGTHTFEIALPSSTVTGLQYEVRVEFTNDRAEGWWKSGWFTMVDNTTLDERAENTELRITQTLGDTLAARIDGIVDHGSVSGTLEIDPATGMHGFDATGPTNLVLLDPPGNTVSVKAASGADQVAVTGLPDAELVDGAWATFVFWRGAWELASAGGASVPAIPDTTPPTAVTDLEVTGGEGQVTASWTPATDAESTVRYRARVYLDGTTPPAWPTSGPLYGLTSPTLTATGLAPGNYRVQVHAYSSGGESAAATSGIAAVTVPLTTLLLDTFTRANGSLIVDQPTPDTGANWTAPGGAVASAQIVGNRLAPNSTVCVSVSPSPAVELTLDVIHPSAAGYVEVGCYGPDFCKVKVKGNGQVEINGAGATAIYNAAGGTNVYTPIGYIAALSYELRVTYSSGVAAFYIDGTKIIEAPYAGTPTVNQVFVSADPATANTYVDNIEAKG